MATLYTNGAFIALTPAQWATYSPIRYSAAQPTLAVLLGLSSSGTVNFAPKLGSVSAEILGWTGNDNITSGSGGDSLWGYDGSDTLTGGLGNDLIVGDWDDGLSVGNDVLYGGDGNDELIGGPGNDALYGGNGDDYFSFYESDSGLDSLFGGAGTDSVSIRRVFTSYNLGTVGFSRIVLNAAASVEYLLWDNIDLPITGTTGNDLFDFSGTTTLLWTGTAFENRIAVDLLAGNDTFIGGMGSEHVTTIGAGDNVQLRDGNDTLSVLDGVITGSTFSGGLGTDVFELGVQTGFNLPVTTLSLNVLNSILAASFENIQIGLNVELRGTDQSENYNLAPVNFKMYRHDFPILLLGGDDRVFGASGDFFADGGIGNDTLRSEGGNDRLAGGEGNDFLYGGAGNDVLDGGGGFDYMVGGEGDDIYSVDSAKDILVETGTTGRDVVWSYRALYRMPLEIEGMAIRRDIGGTGIGNSLNNSIWGGAGNDSLVGRGGDDTLTSVTGRDTLVGGTGDDLYDLWKGSLALVVEQDGQGLDTVLTHLTIYVLPEHVENLVATLSNSNQTLTGNAGANILTGSLGRNFLYGLAGDDTMDGGSGADVLDGGIGWDVYIVDDPLDRVNDSDGSGVVRSSAATYTLGPSIQRLEMMEVATNAYTYGVGNKNDNFIMASAQGNNLFGEGGNDELRGGISGDGLYGGAGYDTLDSGAGNDYLVGGAGNDLYLAEIAVPGQLSLDTIIEEAGGGIDTLIATSASLVMPNYIEILQNDYSSGTVNSAGSKVFGNDQGNWITTGIGQDTLYGRLGADTLTGGLGADWFVVLNGYQNDPLTIITDFESGSDKIAFYFGNQPSPGVSSGLSLTAEKFKVLGPGQKVDADDRVLYNPATGFLSFDDDGSGINPAFKFALIENRAVLTAADFVYVDDEWLF